MNFSAIFSKTGKGVQEASGKTSHLSRADRAVLSAIDGKTNLGEVAKKFEKIPEAKFDALIQQLDKDGFIREVSTGSQSAPPPRPAPAAKAPAAPKAPPSSEDSSDGLDFTHVMKVPSKLSSGAPKPPQMDLAAAARADVERKAQDQSLDYKARQEAELKAKAVADAKAKAEAEAKARAAAEAAARAEAEAKARLEAEAKARAEAEAKVKAAREAAVRLATEAKARGEAEGRAKAEAAEREKARLEADLNAKLAVERKAREEAERRAAEAADLARKELEEKAKREAEELRQRLEAEMKAKLEEERKAREAEDRKRREEEERRRKEEEERRAKEDAERRAKEEAERKKREEEDRKRREEEERRRKEEDERRAKEDAERRAREDSERKKREEEDRKRKAEDERRRKEEDERRTKDDAERRAREDAERKAKAAAEASASLPKIEPVAPPPPPAAAAPAGSDLGDLLGDLESFGKREEEEQKAKEEAERKAKEAAARKAKDEAERKAKEEAERKRREEEERRRKEEEERRAKEDEERKEREEEERRREEEAERKRKAKEAQAAKQAEERAAKAAAKKSAAKGDDDLDVGDEDADMDDIKRDQKALAARAAVRQREQASVVATATGGRPKKWGKPVAIALFAVLVVGLGALNLMPVSTSDYEKAASEVMGVPVKIGSAGMSVLAGVEMKFNNVTIGDRAKIRLVRGSPELGSLFGGRKSFNRIELEGVSASQSQIADALLGKVSGANLRIGRVSIKQLSLEGPVPLPPLDVEAEVGANGGFQTVKLTGGDKIQVQISPTGNDIPFEISAGSLALPFVPALSLSEFGMKGTANRDGVTASEFDGRTFDGVISGTARIRWGANWTIEGEVRARSLKAAVFAPALVSEGRIEGKGNYKMSGGNPATLAESAHLQGEFKIEKGVLGSFDLTRALQTGGAQTTGRTVFNELTGQGVYDKGAVQLRNIAIGAGAMNAAATLDIDASGGLSGRVSADVKTPTQTLRATVNISGKVQDPVIRK